jgi:hypothetical protein
MDYFLAFVLATAGFVWYKTLYRALARFYAKRFHEEFGSLATTMRWDNPEDRWNLLIYQTGIFFLGVSLLAMAFFAAFAFAGIGALAFVLIAKPESTFADHALGESALRLATRSKKSRTASI